MVQAASQRKNQTRKEIFRKHTYRDSMAGAKPRKVKIFELDSAITNLGRYLLIDCALIICLFLENLFGSNFQAFFSEVN